MASFEEAYVSHCNAILIYVKLLKQDSESLEGVINKKVRFIADMERMRVELAFINSQKRFLNKIRETKRTIDGTIEQMVKSCAKEIEKAQSMQEECAQTNVGESSV